MKSKNAILNISTDALGKILMLVLGILLPKLYIDNFGSEMNGLLSSLSGIFVYLNLLEAGVGGASIQALYSPLSQKNNDKINGILSATNRYYKKIGLYFLACVAILSFLYPVVVRSNIDFYLVVILVFLSAIPSALRFFFQGKYTVLLNADNRVYVLNLFTTIFNILSNVMKIILILDGKNIIYVQGVFAIISIIQVVAVQIYVKKKYPCLDFKAKADNKAISKKGSVMIHEIASTIFNNIDVLLLTLFCGLKVVSVYIIYNMIFIQTGFIVRTVSTGLTASFGQLYFENNKKFNKLFNCFETYYQAMVFSIFITAGLLTTPFLKLYTADVTDIEYIDKYLPIFFMIVNILSNVRWPSVIAINIVGHFKETQWRALLETVINLALSITLVTKMGIYGILLGTIVALCYRTIDMIIYSNKYILKKKISKQFIKIYLYGVIAFGLICAYSYLNVSIQNYFEFFIVAGTVFLIVSIVYLVFASLLDNQSMRTLMDYKVILKKNFKGRVNNES